MCGLPLAKEAATFMMCTVQIHARVPQDVRVPLANMIWGEAGPTDPIKIICSFLFNNVWHHATVTAGSELVNALVATTSLRVSGNVLLPGPGIWNCPVALGSRACSPQSWHRTVRHFSWPLDAFGVLQMLVVMSSMKTSGNTSGFLLRRWRFLL